MPNPAALALDLTCLALGPLALNPRGIDRVEMAYARHFLEKWPGECFAVIPTLWGIRYFDRASALRGLCSLDDIWRETISPSDDATYNRAKSFLLGDLVADREQTILRSKTVWETTRDFLRLLGAVRFSFGKAVSSLPHGTIYLNVGQLLFFRPSLSWLGRRKDVLSVLMIHDLIPLEHPDRHVALGVKLHKAIIENASEFASALIVPSAAARLSLQQDFVPPRLASIPTHVELLPVSPAFLSPACPDPDLAGVPYFLACGAIDSHKNHIILLKAWQQLVERHGAMAPALVIAGFPSATSKPVFEFLKNQPALKTKVYIASGLSTPSLRILMISAKALLMPSIVEGFGLPVIEALSQGTAVIASDIPAHREAGAGGDVTFLDPMQPSAWLAAIESFNDREAQLALKSYSPKSWQDYFGGVEAFLIAQARDEYRPELLSTPLS